MSALGAISPEAYVFIVGQLFFVCSVCVLLLALCALNHLASKEEG